MKCPHCGKQIVLETKTRLVKPKANPEPKAKKAKGKGKQK